MLCHLLCALILLFGGDNDVQWNGVSHVPWQDRRPLCPVDGEPFTVCFQTYRFDITAARVHVSDGEERWIEAEFDHDRGPYAVWSANIPGTASAALRYYIELVDGSDVDYFGSAGMSDDPPGDGGFLLDFTTDVHAPIGATPTSDGGAVFKVWAPTRSSVHVRGEFNNWGLADPLAKVGEFFIGRVANVANRAQYKYYFNSSKWNSDARGRALNASENYNSTVEDPLRFDWLVADFATPPLEELIVYQLHVGTFAGRNDPVGSTPFPSRYVDVAARAAHLAELGVNAVMLNPITEFPGDLSAGYNPISAWAPEWKYGSPDDLKYMIDTLHAHGIAVLLDIVWNHFSPTDNYLWFYDGTQTYFDNPAVETPWGSQADFDNAHVRDYFADSARAWLGEFRFDGFRMDATDFMNLPAQEAAGWALMQRLNDEIDNRFIDKVAIAEQLPDDPWVTRPTNLGGAGFDCQYFDAFTDQLRQEIFDAAFGDPEMWRIRNILYGDGPYLSGARAFNYLELHDEAWPENGGKRIVKTIDTTFPHDDMWAKGRVKLAQGLVIFAPGVPALLQGTEWLEDTGFGATSTSRIDWSKKSTYASIFRYFQDVIAVRKGNGGLRAGSPVDVFHVNESANVLAFHRWDYAGNDLVVIANFSNDDFDDYRLGLPQAGTWYELINSQDARYDGNGLTNDGRVVSEPVSYDGYPQSATFRIPQMGLLLFRYDDGPAVRGDLNCDGGLDGADIDPFFLALGDPQEYARQFPDCDFLNADMNGDESVDGADIDVFFECLGQGCP